MKRFCMILGCFLFLLSIRIEVLADEVLNSTDYQDFSTVEETVDKLQNYIPSGLDSYQQKVANTITRGIVKYFQ